MRKLNTPDIKIGYPDSNGAAWQFNMRPAESIDAAGVEIVSYPADQYTDNVAPACRVEADSLSCPMPASVRWLLKKIIS